MDHSYETYLLSDDGVYPNNERLVVVVYQQVFIAEPSVDPDIIERQFNKNGWVNCWRNGIYREHHYHSSAHEVLGIYSGWIKTQLGGPDGKMVVAGAGDAIIIPAGVAHKNLDQSADFRVIGGYPQGQLWDINFGKAGERPLADEKINNVPLPLKDPVFGTSGPIKTLWG